MQGEPSPCQAGSRGVLWGRGVDGAQGTPRPHVLLPLAGDGNKYFNEIQFPGTNCSRSWRSLTRTFPGVPELDSKLSGFYLKPVSRSTKFGGKRSRLHLLSPRPDAGSPPLCFRRPVNMAGSNNNLSTHKTHPPKRVFPGQSCDKGFKYRKRQRELNKAKAL